MTKEGNSLRFPELGGDSFCGGVFFSLPTASPFILASITGFVSRVAGRGSCYFGGCFFFATLQGLWHLNSPARD